LFSALAAVFLGATTINPGRYNVWGSIIGVFFVAISVSGFTLLGADAWVQPVFNGGALITAVALSKFMARSRDKHLTGTVARTIQALDHGRRPNTSGGESAPT
jgi:ribose transport system permease protein